MFGTYARNVIASQGRYVPDKPKVLEEKPIPKEQAGWFNDYNCSTCKDLVCLYPEACNKKE